MKKIVFDLTDEFRRIVFPEHRLKSLSELKKVCLEVCRVLSI